MPVDPREVLTRPAPAPDFTEAYGGHPDQVFDVRGAGPLLVFVHGGFWRAEYDRAHVGPLSCGFAAEGFRVATIEFRRTGQPGGGWPGTFDDITLALAEVPRILGQEIALVSGHSAGGHLALWASGGRPALALAPVTGLAGAHELDDRAAHLLLGGGPSEVPERYLAAEPSAVGTLIHGTDDAQVPVELSRAYAARTGSRLVELPGVEHFGLIDPLSAAWPTVLAEARAAIGT
ncbi:alpha/beta hydrolase [Longispora sp. K20-0274]|uniref:alpha/beta hydrolase family protein n=1 Tax=Longispora sp. K20-0274 TaxID=3088255 RepID=UPI00399A3D68